MFWKFVAIQAEQVLPNFASKQITPKFLPDATRICLCPVQLVTHLFSLISWKGKGEIKTWQSHTGTILHSEMTAPW